MRRHHREGGIVTYRTVHVAVLLAVASSLQAQWLDYRVPRVPRLKTGKPNLFSPAPKTREKKPDLSGTWLVPTHGEEGLADPPPKYLVNLAADFKPGELPILSWADALSQQRA